MRERIRSRTDKLYGYYRALARRERTDGLSHMQLEDVLNPRQAALYGSALCIVL